ncbi:aldo/keto reductase [Paractinoplanes hotanensis]|uniref:Aldo/keto reductase n=1 Tax=Paractinoplanes hotanensis TaxID=2906497 RepID=A0ABT0XZK2_9ACTN|nr:aldo/keto reductase [Actinoplanes hotanensis]MCM4079221.1 aldo/keto reductase [Actinoplanes hotanensis]
MHHRTLGRTGIQVSPYALGTLMFASPMGNTGEESARILHRALDAGINFVDTADAYADSEEVVGRALVGRRDEVVLATKFGRPTGPGANQQGASRRWIVSAVEASLRRLRTDHIDLYQLHRPDPATDLEETLAALTDLISSGKVLAIGASGTPVSAIVEAQWIAERRGLARFHTEQPVYSLLNRGIEREILPALQHFGMGALVWGPLGQGLLTGRVRKDGDNDLRRSGLLRHVTDERRLDVVEQLIPLAAEAGLPLTHLAMAFTIAHPGVTSALIGVRTMDHLDALLAGLDVTLTDELLDRIDEIVPPGTDIGVLDQAVQPPALLDAGLRRRPWATRAVTEQKPAA